MSDASFWFVETVQSEPYLGPSGLGERYGQSVTVACWVEDGNHLIRNSEGNEVVSSAMVYADVADAANLTVGSRVTIPGRRGPSQVLTLDRYESGTLNLGLDHVVAHLQ